jgi:6-pyruvoyltetrahydropterin/6-carboxytetrahydropterin synthase
VEIAIASEALNKIGLVVDFRELKAKLKEMVGRWDHVCLNDLQEFKEMNPSTENMARLIYQGFKKDLPKDVCMKHTRIWESDGASVCYSEERKA